MTTMSITIEPAEVNEMLARHIRERIMKTENQVQIIQVTASMRPVDPNNGTLQGQQLYVMAALIDPK